MYKSSKTHLMQRFLLMVWFREKSEGRIRRLYENTNIESGMSMNEIMEVILRDPDFMVLMMDGRRHQSVIQKINLLLNDNSEHKFTDIIKDLELSKGERYFLSKEYMYDNLKYIFEFFKIKYEKINDGFFITLPYNDITYIAPYNEYQWICKAVKVIDKDLSLIKSENTTSSNEHIFDYFDMIQGMEIFYQTEINEEKMIF